jgi:hypothetical protein
VDKWTWVIHWVGAVRVLSLRLGCEFLLRSFPSKNSRANSADDLRCAFESGRKLSLLLGSPPGAPLRVDFIATQIHPPCRIKFRDKAKLEKTDERRIAFLAVGHFAVSGNVSSDESFAVQGKNALHRRPFAMATCSFMFDTLTLRHLFRITGCVRQPVTSRICLTQHAKRNRSNYLILSVLNAMTANSTHKM